MTVQYSTVLGVRTVRTVYALCCSAVVHVQMSNLGPSQKRGDIDPGIHIPVIYITVSYIYHRPTYNKEHCRTLGHFMTRFLITFRIRIRSPSTKLHSIPYMLGHLFLSWLDVIRKNGFRMQCSIVRGLKWLLSKHFHNLGQRDAEAFMSSSGAPSTSERNRCGAYTLR